MKKFITLFAIAISLISCTDNSLTPQEEYSEMYRKGANEQDNVTIELNTTYKDFEVTITDLNGKEPNQIYQGKENFKAEFQFKYSGRYVISFKPKSTVNNPYFALFIHNKTTNKVIEDYSYNGCMVGYTNSFLIK